MEEGLDRRKRMDDLIRSLIDLWVKLEDKHEGLTKFCYDKKFKEMEKKMDECYRDHRFELFIKVLADMRNYLMQSVTNYTQVEIQFNGNDRPS